MAIPKVIHYCWFGGGKLPKSAVKCIKSWKKFCPDYQIKCWSEEDFDLNANAYTREAYEHKAWGFVPDYLRLWIVYNYGGIYLDTDVQVIKSLDPLLEHKAFAGMESPDFVALGLGFGAEAGDPLLREHLTVYDDMRFVNEDGTLNKIPSPRYTTDLFAAHGFVRGNPVVQQVETFTVYPPEFFSPKSFETGLVTATPNTYSIHQFDASWFTEEQQVEKLQRWDECKKRDRQLRVRLAARKVLGDSLYEGLRRVVKGR